MTTKKLSIAILSIILVTSGLTACGGSDSSFSSTGTGTANTPPVNTNLSDIEQAKEIIRTAKLFVTDANSVQKTYDNASALLTDKQQGRFGTAMDVPYFLHDYMRKNNLTTLTADQIKALTQRSNNYDSLYAQMGSVSLVPSSDFSIYRGTDDTLTVNGTLMLSEDTYDYGSRANGYQKTFVNTDSYPVVFDNYNDAMDKVQNNTSTINSSFGFNSITVGSGAEAVIIKANPSAGVLTANLSKNINYNYDFGVSDAHAAGVTLNKGEASFKNVVLTANNNTVTVTELSASALDITNIVNGQTLVRTVPYQFKVTGQLQMAAPKTDVTISLNVTAKEADVKNMLVIDTNEALVERNNMMLPVTALVSIKGQATGENNKAIPLDFQAKLSRKGSKIISLDDLSANVEGKTLYALGSSNFDTNNDLLNSEVTFKQNNATVTVKFDKNNDAISTNGKIADILVNNKDYGDLIDNGSMITAKFTDNSLITL